VVEEATATTEKGAAVKKLEGGLAKMKKKEAPKEEAKPLVEEATTTKKEEVVVKEAQQNIEYGENKDTDIAYHGTPYNYDSFDASKIGTGEGAAKRGKGIYLMRSKRFAPYFANINNEDAPIHIGKGKSKADKNKIDPRVIEVFGINNLNSQTKMNTKKNTTLKCVVLMLFLVLFLAGFGAVDAATKLNDATLSININFFGNFNSINCFSIRLSLICSTTSSIKLNIVLVNNNSFSETKLEVS
jgi:hypothetical protein